MNAMKNKIKSQRGASITFALLLFLVCAMVSSVVIVAATTAGGRMSNLPDIDQRYYAVSSAAELLGKTLDGQVVTVVKTRDRTIKSSYLADGSKNGDPVKTPGEIDTTIYPGDLSEDATLEDEDNTYSLLTSLADTLTNNVLVDMDDDAAAESTETYPIKVSRTLNATGSLGLTSDSLSNADGLAILSVEMYQQLDKDGTLTFYVSKPVKNSAGTVTGAYTLRLIFAADKTKDTTSYTEHGSPVATSGGGYTVTDTETKTTTIKYKWTLTRIEKSTVPTGFPALT